MNIGGFDEYRDCLIKKFKEELSKCAGEDIGPVSWPRALVGWLTEMVVMSVCIFIINGSEYGNMHLPWVREAYIDASEGTSFESPMFFYACVGDIYGDAPKDAQTIRETRGHMLFHVTLRVSANCRLVKAKYSYLYGDCPAEEYCCECKGCAPLPQPTLEEDVIRV